MCVFFTLRSDAIVHDGRNHGAAAKQRQGTEGAPEGTGRAEGNEPETGARGRCVSMFLFFMRVAATKCTDFLAKLLGDSFFAGRVKAYNRYHCGRKYSGRLGIHMKSKRSLYFRPDWYHFSHFIVGKRSIKQPTRGFLAPPPPPCPFWHRLYRLDLTVLSVPELFPSPRVFSLALGIPLSLPVVAFH